MYPIYIGVIITKYYIFQSRKLISRYESRGVVQYGEEEKEIYSEKDAELRPVVPLTDDSPLFRVGPLLPFAFRRDVVHLRVQRHPSRAVDDCLSNLRVPLLDGVQCGCQSFLVCFELSFGVIEIHTRKLHLVANASDAFDELLSVLLVHYPCLQQTLLG